MFVLPSWVYQVIGLLTIVFVYIWVKIVVKAFINAQKRMKKGE